LFLFESTCTYMMSVVHNTFPFYIDVFFPLLPTILLSDLTIIRYRSTYMYIYFQIKTISSPQSKWQIKSFTLPFFKITELAVIVPDRLIVKM
jgi:hypothetical protein